MTKPFVDHFGSLAANYTMRPHYPAELFAWLAEHSPSLDTVWDCACGTGQASHDLAKYFDNVIATDASEAQIRLAVANSTKSEFRCAAAETSGLPNRSVDLINVGIAAHWFDLPAFYEEVRRVAKPAALLALLVYGDPVIENAKLNRPLQDFAATIEPYGFAERRHVKEGYRNLFFPFSDEIQLPPMDMKATMTPTQFSNYLHSRSPVKDFIQKENRDPVAELEKILIELQVSADKTMKIQWPLSARIAKVTPQKTLYLSERAGPQRSSADHPFIPMNNEIGRTGINAPQIRP